MSQALIFYANTFKGIQQANIDRCKRWHKTGIDDWSIQDWAVALAGETGEICNAVKKLRRLEDEIASINDPGRQISSRQEAIDKIAEECADTFAYLDMLMSKIGRDLQVEVAKKFNSGSLKYCFPERIVYPEYNPLAGSNQILLCDDPSCNGDCGKPVLHRGNV